MGVLFSAFENKQQIYALTKKLEKTQEENEKEKKKSEAQMSQL
jgi:hypothetical protein